MQIEKNQNHEKRDRITQEEGSSLILILVQAIETNDSETIKFVIEQENVEMINNTLDQFTNENLFSAFVRTLLSRLRSSPQETTNVLRWLDVFLKKKSTFLQRNSELVSELKSAKEILVVKEKLHSNLLRLKGKIAYLIDSKKSQQNPDRFLSHGFGIPRIVIDEREVLENGHDYQGDDVNSDSNDENQEIEDEQNEVDEENDLLYEEEYEQEVDDANDDDDEANEDVEQLGMELEEELENKSRDPVSKKEKHLAMKNQPKRAKKRK